jgi:hypothetical protein
MSALNNIMERKKRVNREAALYTGRLKLDRAIKKLAKIPIASDRHQNAAKKIQKAWRELNKTKIEKYREEKAKRLQSEVNRLMKNLEKMNVNVNMYNVAPDRPRKRKTTNSNSDSNNNQALTYRKREVELPNLVIGRGMGCDYAGIPRYMKKAKQRFNNAGYVSAFLDYDIPTNRYGITKNINTIVNRFGKVYETNSRISVSKQVHFFMVGLRTPESAHAISVLVDPRDPKNRRVWVFDPHGEASRTSVWGKTMRKKVVPIIRKLFKIPGRKVRYYNGRNLQADNTRGVCTTFYVTFMDMIPYLLNGVASINQITEIANKNSTAIRQFFLNFAPENAGIITTKIKTR